MTELTAYAAHSKMTLAGALASQNGSSRMAIMPPRDILVPISWEVADETHRHFQALIGELIAFKDGRTAGGALDGEQLTRAGFQVYGSLSWDDVRSGKGAVLVREFDGWPLVVGMIRGGIFRKEQGSVHTGDLSFYNLNPAVSPTVLNTQPLQRLPVGGEIEIGLVDLDGEQPPDAKLARFRQSYADYAAGLGLSKLDKEASAYQVEGQTPPVLTFDEARRHVDLILAGVVRASPGAAA